MVVDGLEMEREGMEWRIYPSCFGHYCLDCSFSSEHDDISDLFIYTRLLLQVGIMISAPCSSHSLSIIPLKYFYLCAQLIGRF